jgi:hypothetical protein
VSGTAPSCSRYGPTVESFEHGNETLGFAEDEVLD